MSPSAHDPSVQGTYADARKCPFCGKPVPDRLNHCPFCREAIPTVSTRSGFSDSEGRYKIRRGLLYMLLAGLVYYFAGGFSPWRVPIPIPGFVSEILAPLLFVAGAGFALYGLYIRIRS